MLGRRISTFSFSFRPSLGLQGWMRGKNSEMENLTARSIEAPNEIGVTEIS